MLSNVHRQSWFYYKLQIDQVLLESGHAISSFFFFSFSMAVWMCISVYLGWEDMVILKFDVFISAYHRTLETQWHY